MASGSIDVRIHPTAAVSLDVQAHPVAPAVGNIEVRIGPPVIPLAPRFIVHPQPLEASGRIPVRVFAGSIIKATIDQLREACPEFEGRVAGAADFRAGLQDYNASLKAPAAYVIPLDQTSNGNQTMIGLVQVVQRTVGVVVEFDARADRRGQAPAMDYDRTQTLLCKALLNFGTPFFGRIANNQGYWLSGGRMLDLDRARLFYQWEFTLDWQLDDCNDGWQPPSEDLVAMDLDIHLQPLSRHPDPSVRMRIANLQPSTIWDSPTSPTFWDNGRTDWPT